jgi:hypothetical protein
MSADYQTGSKLAKQTYQVTMICGAVYIAVVFIFVI